MHDTNIKGECLLFCIIRIWSISRQIDQAKIPTFFLDGKFLDFFEYIFGNNG